MADRKSDLYESPPAAVHALLRHYTLPQHVWEPACGPGVIVRELRAAGHEVHATDLVDYGERRCPDSLAGVDFLMQWQVPPGVEAVVTNPPFCLADEFVRHALHLVPEVVVLLRLAALEGAGRADIIDRHLSLVLLGKERLPMMRRDGWMGPKNGNSGAPFAWFVFRRTPTNGVVTLRRISWREGA